MRTPNAVPASLSERAYLLIRQKILRGEIPLGAPLSRRKLAVQYGMSFLPVSDAIRRLEHEGLVESKPRVGTRVRIPTAQDVRDCYILREALECQSARLFAEKASSQERCELQIMAKRVDSLMKEANGEDADPDSVFNAQAYHLSFHMRIAECTGCLALRDTIEKNQILIFNWLYDITARLVLPPRRHEELMAAILQGDPQAAETAMREHINYGSNQIQEAISSSFGSGIGHTGRAEPPALPPLVKRQQEKRWRVKLGTR
ncbi:MAG: GntR family transcriptional regulator [Terriglobia bacterium]